MCDCEEKGEVLVQDFKVFNYLVILWLKQNSF